MIVKHFIDESNDPHVPIKYLGFVMIDVLNNVEHFSENDNGCLLLHKENFWTGTLVNQHK